MPRELLHIISKQIVLHRRFVDSIHYYITKKHFYLFTFTYNFLFSTGGRVPAGAHFGAQSLLGRLANKFVKVIFLGETWSLETAFILKKVFICIKYWKYQIPNFHWSAPLTAQWHVPIVALPCRPTTTTAMRPFAETTHGRMNTRVRPCVHAIVRL